MEAIGEIDDIAICWVDQCGVDKYYHRSHGRALQGKRIYASVPGKRFIRTNLTAGYLNGKIVAPFQYEGTTNSDLIEGWFEEHLLKAVPGGTTFAIDSASFYRKSILCDIVEESGNRLISLPTYSPDLNKIEYAVWANMKNHLRNYSKNFKSLNDALVDYFRFK